MNTKRKIIQKKSVRCSKSSLEYCTTFIQLQEVNVIELGFLAFQVSLVNFPLSRIFGVDHPSSSMVANGDQVSSNLFSSSLNFWYRTDLLSTYSIDTFTVQRVCKMTRQVHCRSRSKCWRWRSISGNDTKSDEPSNAVWSVLPYFIV